MILHALKIEPSDSPQLYITKTMFWCSGTHPVAVAKCWFPSFTLRLHLPTNWHSTMLKKLLASMSSSAKPKEYCKRVLLCISEPTGDPAYYCPAPHLPLSKGISSKKEFALHLHRSATGQAHGSNVEYTCQNIYHPVSGSITTTVLDFDGKCAPHQNCVCCILGFWTDNYSATVEELLLVPIHVLGDRVIFNTVVPGTSRHHSNHVHVVSIPNGLLEQLEWINKE